MSDELNIHWRKKAAAGRLIGARRHEYISPVLSSIRRLAEYQMIDFSGIVGIQMLK